MDTEYCGMRTSNVKQSSRGGRSRKGNAQKPKKAHSRRTCYGTNDVSLRNTESCRRSRDNYRCVVKQKTPGKDLLADRSRAKSRAKHAARRSSTKVNLAGGNPYDERGVKIPSMEYCKVKPGTHTCVMTDKPEEQSENCLHNLKTRRCIYYDPELGDDVFNAQQQARAAARDRNAAASAAHKRA
jgi:hypothetical protein